MIEYKRQLSGNMGFFNKMKEPAFLKEAGDVQLQRHLLLLRGFLFHPSGTFRCFWLEG